LRNIGKGAYQRVDQIEYVGFFRALPGLQVGTRVK